MKWSAESPNLYRVVLSVVNPQGETVESRAQNVGFRKVAFSAQNELLINGQPIKLMGVNRHDHHPVTGKALTRADILQDVKLIKQFNFNAVRTSHYPNDPYFCDLCDEYGIYVMAEANIECHHLGSYIPQQPSWALPILSRIYRLVERDKNHPSVISWSMGNEAGSGPAFAAAAGWIRDFDPSRFIHYEGAQGDPTDPAHKPDSGFATQQWPEMANPDDPPYVDVISRMYSRIDQVKNLANNPDIDRPIVMCEYVHAMGNSIGTLGEYWDLIHSKPNLIGGFIWDMVDQGIEQTHESGQTFYAYGGDFGDVPNSGNFCFNGVFASDRPPNPHAWECRYVFQPAIFESVDGNPASVRVTNRFAFTNLNEYEMRWALSADGDELQSGILTDQDVKPGDSAVLKFPVKEFTTNEGTEYWLRVSLHESKDRLWCEKGYEVAKGQMVYQSKSQTASEPYVTKKAGNVATDSTNSAITITGETFSAAVSKTTGQLTSWKVNDAEQLASPMRPNFWRPLTDNDARFIGFSNKKRLWQDMHTKLKTVSVDAATNEDDSITVSVLQKADNKVKLNIVYTFFNDATISVKLDLDADESLPDMPKFGVTMGVPSQYTSTTYYGGGPWESYSDRKRSVEIDEYQLPTDDLFHNYAMPQENGNRTETRWLKLSGDEGSPVIKVTGDPTFNFSVWPYSIKNIYDAKHPYDLKRQGFYTLNIDHSQTGVGGMTTRPLPHQLVKPGKLSFSFLMQARN